MGAILFPVSEIRIMSCSRDIGKIGQYNFEVADVLSGRQLTKNLVDLLH